MNRQPGGSAYGRCEKHQVPLIHTITEQTCCAVCLAAEVERLRAELAEAQADRMRGNCKIMADDCDCGLCKREREIERLQGQVADMSLVIERLRTVMQAVASMPGRDWLMAQIALGQALGDGGKQLDWVLRWHSQAAEAAGGGG
jgi:hypothetical protein